MKTLDLRDDFAEISTFVADRVRSWDATTNDGPGEGGSVARLDVGFGLAEPAWVCIVFDTRPDAGPDGEWNGHIQGNDLARPRWEEAFDAVSEEEPLALILPDGSRRELVGDDAGLVEAVGEMLKAVLLKARADGLFDPLPKAPRCELGVEEQDGAYAWPIYEDRGRENLA